MPWEGQVYNAKDGKFYSSTIKPVGSDQLEIQGCVLGFLCGGETWTRVAGPIPSSPANSMAKGAPKTTATDHDGNGDEHRAEDHWIGQPGSQIAKSTTRHRTASADPVGDICLLPDIARFAH